MPRRTAPDDDRHLSVEPSDVGIRVRAAGPKPSYHCRLICRSQRRHVARTRMKADYAAAAKLFRGFGDISRLRVLEALGDGPLPVGAVVARTGLSQPNVSMHLACLAACGLVTKEPRGRFVHYAIADRRVIRVLESADELLGAVASLIDACARYPEPTMRRRRPTLASNRGRSPRLVAQRTRKGGRR